jgi:hypothetical protein
VEDTVAENIDMIADQKLNKSAMKGWNDWLSAWLGAVARAWTDERFKAFLLNDARGALKELGYEVPAVLDLKVIEILGETDAQRLPESSHSPFVFAGGVDLPPQSLTIGLLPPPKDLADGLVTLANHSGLSTVQCFCACS